MLSIQLADRGESGGAAESVAKTEGLVQALIHAAAEYPKRRELADAQAVLDRLEGLILQEG